MTPSPSLLQPFLLILCAISSCLAAPCTGTSGTKLCQTYGVNQLNCSFVFPMAWVTGTAPIAIVVKGFPQSNIAVTTATATSTGPGCAAGFTITGPTAMSDSCYGVNNIAAFTTPSSTTTTDMEVTVVAQFSNVGTTSSDAVGVWVNDKLLLSWSATTAITPIPDVCSLFNWTTTTTCSDLTIGFFEPVVCSVIFPVLVTKAKTVFDVNLKLPSTVQDIHIERAVLSSSMGANCTSVGLPSYEIKKINSAVGFPSSSYWFDNIILRINFYGDLTISAQVAYKLQVDFFVSQISAFTPPIAKVMDMSVVSNDGASTNQTISVPNTTVSPSAAYLSCNQRALYYLDWTTCKSVYLATAAGSLRLLINTTVDLQIEDVQVPQYYCTDCGGGYSFPTVTITNLVNSRATGYVDVTWTMGGLSQLLVVVDISVSSIVLQFPLGANGTVTVDRVITGSNVTTESLNLTLVGFPMTNNATEITLVDKTCAVIQGRMSFFEVEFALPIGYNEHFSLGAQQSINTSSEWIIFTGINVKWESTVKLIDESSYFGNINRTGSNGNSILVDLGRISTFGNSSQAIITATFYGIAQAPAVNRTLDILFFARSDDLTSFGTAGYTFSVVGTQPTENSLISTDYPSVVTVNVTQLNPQIQVGELVRVDAYLQFNVLSVATPLQKFQYLTAPNIITATFANQQVGTSGNFLVESVSTADVGANIPCYASPLQNVTHTALTSGSDVTLTLGAGCFVWRDSSTAAQAMRISALMRRVVGIDTYSSTSATIKVNINIGGTALAQATVTLTLTPNTQYDNGITYSPSAPALLRPSFYFALNQTYTPLLVGPFVFNVAVFVGTATTSTRLEFESLVGALSVNPLPFSNKTTMTAKGFNYFGAILPTMVFSNGNKLTVDLDAVTPYPMMRATAAGPLNANIIQFSIAVLVNPMCTGSSNLTARLVDMPNGTLQQMTWNMTPAASGNATHLTSTFVDTNAASLKLYKSNDTIQFQLHFGHATDSFLQCNSIKVVITYPTVLQFLNITNQTSTNGITFNVTLQGNNTLLLLQTANPVLGLTDYYDGFFNFKVLASATDFPAGTFPNYTAIIASQVFYAPCPSLVADPTVWPFATTMTFAKFFVGTTSAPFDMLPISNCQVAAVSSITGFEVANGNAYVSNSSQILWAPAPYADLEQWYQFYFGQQTIVSGFQINTNGSLRGPVGSIRLDYQPYTSSDPWRTAYTFTISASYWNSSVKSVVLSLPAFIQCASIRIVYHDTLIPMATYMSSPTVAMNFYVYGKAPMQNFTCIQNATVSPDVLVRAYLTAGIYIFVCNDQSLRDNATKCYRSDTTNSTTWTALAPYVRNVVKYDSSTTYLYGLHRDKVTYLVSSDYGLSWTILNPQSTYASITGGSVTMHVSPPYSGTNSINAQWTTKEDGVYNPSTLVLSWANFCF